MKLNFYVTGSERKDFINVLGGILGIEPKYRGGRDAVFTVGDFMINKDGYMEGPFTLLLLEKLEKAGYPKYSFADKDSENEYYELGERETEEVSPAEHTEPESALTEDIPAESCDTTTEETDTSEADHYSYEDYKSISYPKDGFTYELHNNLLNLISSAQSLLKKALNVSELTVREERSGEGQDVLVFYMFDPILSTNIDTWSAYTTLVTMLCEKAKQLRKVDPAEQPIEDEKFEFSRYLHRIGMVGAVYKKQRKLLMQNLGGSTWRKGVEEREARRAVVEEAV
ncbi:hypothetical protein FACS1894184_03510 [Clostridia bacterium]|nr:hypothetical protein FACS1894184_03510 [Clostridia bacterium]